MKDDAATIEIIPPAKPAAAARRLLFISHAAPEDNEFAKWLATQLTIAGYEVWCDVTDLLGGEKFWTDIEDAIDAYALRVLFVSTLAGNTKPGTQRELRLAQAAQSKRSIKDFLVPLKIDAFPFASMLESVRDLNCVRFDGGWAAGLAQLLALLEREGVPKSPDANAAVVTDWYRRAADPRRKTVVSNDRQLSNWFRLVLPETLYFHRFRGSAEQLQALAAPFRRPFRVHGNFLCTFAPLHEVEEQLGPGWDIDAQITAEPQGFIRDGDPRLEIEARDALNIVNDLVRQAWEAEMQRQDLTSYELASGLLAWFFREGQLEKNKVGFKGAGGKITRRQLVGRKSKKLADRKRVPDGFWHYAVSASIQLLPYPRIALRHHVVFTDDGAAPWKSAERMHKARRSVCKNWWNAEWRDRLLAMCARLGGGAHDLPLPVSDQQSIRLAMVPMSFVSPWTYFEDKGGGVDESEEIELIEEADEEEEEGDESDDGGE